MDNIINKLLVNSDIKSNDYVQGLVDMYRSLGHSKDNEINIEDESIGFYGEDGRHLYEITKIIKSDNDISDFNKEYKLNLIKRIKEAGVSQLVNVNSIDLSDRDIFLLKFCYKIIQNREYSTFFSFKNKANILDSLELLDRLINKK